MCTNTKCHDAAIDTLFGYFALADKTDVVQSGAPLRTDIASAIVFMRRLPKRFLPPLVTLINDGTVQFLWETVEFYVVIGFINGRVSMFSQDLITHDIGKYTSINVFNLSDEWFNEHLSALGQMTAEVL